MEEASLLHVIIFSFAGGVLSLSVAIALLKSESTGQKLALYATPFAAGALLAAVFLDLLPEGVEQASSRVVMTAALAGVLSFFLADNFLRWFHRHPNGKNSNNSQDEANRGLIIIGDTMHNALDGVVIGAAFLVSIPTGIVASIAVAAHEIPQEIGDFGLLLSKGMSRLKVLLVNVFSAFATVLTAVATFLLGSAESFPVGLLLGLSAGFLLYIATSDIIPSIHAHNRGRRLINAQIVLVMIGVILVGAVINIAHDYLDHGHNHAPNSSHGVDHSH